MEHGLDVTQDYILSMIENLALVPYSRESARKMPPKASSWQPSDSDLKAVLEWIEAGVPDAQGRKHISLDWLAGLRAVK